jgi:hypothetical protein
MKNDKNIKALILVLIFISFITCTQKDEQEDEIEPTIPLVSTNNLGVPTFNSVEVWGAISSDGGSPILSHGFCWSEKEAPKISDTKVERMGNQMGEFRENITNLEEGYTYYIRAFAINKVGIAYGAEKTFTTGMSCMTMVQRNPGYQVWAGNEPFYSLEKHYEYFYNIDKHGYKLIGESTVTKTFDTEEYKYFVIVAKYWSCIDAIQFNNNTYYDHGPGVTLYSGLSEVDKMRGAPDGIFGALGNITLCPPDNSSFNGFVTDNVSMLSRGKGLKVIVGTGCQ